MSLFKILLSQRWDLNPQPTVYDTVALPLCYVGDLAGYRNRTGALTLGRSCTATILIPQEKNFQLSITRLGSPREAGFARRSRTNFKLRYEKNS